MDNLPAAHFLTANEQGAEATREETPRRVVGFNQTPEAREPPHPGTLARRDVALEKASTLLAVPRPRAPSPAAGPDPRHPAGQNFQRLPRQHPPLPEGLGSGGKREDLAARPAPVCSHADFTSTDLPPSTSTTLSQIGDLP